MAYEDLYAGTEDIPAGEDYWVRIKTTLTADEKERADKHLHKVRGTLDQRGKMQSVVAPDLEAYQRALVAVAIVDWNLDEQNGQKWALSPDSALYRNVGRLPNAVYNRIFARVQELNKEDPEEDRQFRTDAGSSDSDEDTRATDSSEVSDRDGAVESAWDTSETPR